MKLRKNDLLYAGLTAEEYKKIEPDVMQENRHNLTLYSAIVAVFFAVMFVLSLFFQIAKAGRWFYLGGLCVDLILFVSFKYAKMGKTAVLLCVYFFWSVMLAAGILLAVIVAPAKNTVTFIALILIAPLLFTDKPIRVIGFIDLFAIAFVVAAAFLKDPSVRMMDIIHVVLFTTVSVIVGFVVIRAKYQRCLYNYNLKVLSLTDLLTGVNNRNSFEINKSARIGLCAKVMGCCYVDANGLHECNNEFGHNNGDELLKNIAKELTGLFGRENVYRI
ncbi:MAG: GGDEF domain-containing protein, partial [Candidatus Gallimonas sp.]